MQWICNLCIFPSSRTGWKRRTEWGSVTTTCIVERPSSSPDLTVSHLIKGRCWQYHRTSQLVLKEGTFTQTPHQANFFNFDHHWKWSVCDLWLPLTKLVSSFSTEGNWKFGLKDLAISSGKTGISTKYPLEGKDYFHASNCDTHNAYHQVTEHLCAFYKI